MIAGSALVSTVMTELGIHIDFQGIYNAIVKWIAGVISNVSLYSKLKDDNPISSSAMSMDLSQPELGLVTGNGFTMGIDFTATIVKGPGKSKWNWTHSRGGDVADVNDSTAYAQWEWNSATGSVTHDTPTYSPISCSTATDSNPQRNCKSQTTVTVTPQEAVRNLGIALTTGPALFATLSVLLGRQHCLRLLRRQDDQRHVPDFQRHRCLE